MQSYEVLTFFPSDPPDEVGDMSAYHAAHPADGTPGTGMGLAAESAQQSALQSSVLLIGTIVS